MGGGLGDQCHSGVRGYPSTPKPPVLSRSMWRVGQRAKSLFSSPSAAGAQLGPGGTPTLPRAPAVRCGSSGAGSPPAPLSGAWRPELSPALESGHQVTCDDAGCHPVLRGGLGQIWQRQPCLLDRESGDPPSRVIFLHSVKECREESPLQSFLHQPERLTDPRGDTLREWPLLLE